MTGMAQRGRKSGTKLVVMPRFDGTPERLSPPSSLSEAERAAFLQIVGSCSPRHFLPSDLPLVVSYACAITLDRVAAEHLRDEGAVVNGKPSPWLVVQEKQHRAMVSLSLRLRLSPQGRAQVAPKAEPIPSAYERMRVEENNATR
jgi:phage terminase small subunit